MTSFEPTTHNSTYLDHEFLGGDQPSNWKYFSSFFLSAFLPTRLSTDHFHANYRTIGARQSGGLSSWTPLTIANQQTMSPTTLTSWASRSNMIVWVCVLLLVQVGSVESKRGLCKFISWLTRLDLNTASITMSHIVFRPSQLDLIIQLTRSDLHSSILLDLYLVGPT